MHRIIVAFILLSSLSLTTSAQYFQQQVSYEINAAIDTNHVISGSCDITYTNNSTKSLDTLFVHLYANAFSDKLSKYSEQTLRLGRLDFYFSDDEEMGGYEDLTVQLNDKTVQLYAWQGNKDVVYIIPGKSIAPGETIELATSYKLQLPRKFSRFGWLTNDHYLMYWYPVMAQFDGDGWHPTPYQEIGETYQNTADYQVNLVTDHPHLISSGPWTKNGSNYQLQGSQMPDYAIITSKNKPVISSQIESINGSAINIHVMSKDSSRRESIKKYLADAIPYFEKVIGPYPYPSLSIFDKGPDAQSGMEYPGLITVSGKDEGLSELQYYIVHELLHEYFYGALAFNQRDYAWLDEGLTTHYQQRYYLEELGVDFHSSRSSLVQNEGSQPVVHTSALAQACRHDHASISAPLDQISPLNYGLNAYEVPARMYAHLAEYIGLEIWDQALQEFYQTWKGKHPGPSDLQKVLEEKANKDLSWFFGPLINENWAYDYAIDDLKDGILSVTHKTGSTPPYSVTLLTEDGQKQVKWIDGHSDTQQITVDTKWTSAILDESQLSMDIDRNNNYANVRRPLTLAPFYRSDRGGYKEVYTAPIASFNTSDGIMLCVLFHNSTLPPKNLKWAISPAYAFGSKSLVGEGWVSYNQYLNANRFSKIKYGINVKRYGFRNSETLDLSLSYTRVSPSVQLHFRHDPADQKRSNLYLQSVSLQEEFFQFEGEQVSIKDDNNQLFRLGYRYQNDWKLSPTGLDIRLEQQSYTNAVGESHNYLKLIAEIEKGYHFSASQAINFRLWGTYFLQNTQRQSANFDGAITRGSAALIYQGFNDYAYDDYFFNRQNQDASLSNQISYGGGGFKTPVGSQYGIGQSNDLAIALNVSSDLPIKMPKFLPLKLFFDLGYYTSKGASIDPLTANTIYSGGIMLDYLDGLVSVHLPMFNSAAISEIYDTEGTGLLGKISFSIDLHRWNPWDKIDEERP